eukprot:TRINITY_DN30298_c0_g1_i1.p1 TRINITY_DN30298_c0_g1~~TRINITY_DN30298_c0_g1_i1.p1  ORF type:complete len:491 (-),score=113.88 TRINITY_DN30298_c0_g1_i1:9-1481(-)
MATDPVEPPLEQRDLEVPPGVHDLGLGLSGDPPQQVVVASIRPGQWAENCGVQPGDELLALDGMPVTIMPGAEMIEKMRKNRPLQVSFRRPAGYRRLVMSGDGQMLGLHVSWPPGPMKVLGVMPGAWAAFVGVKVGDEIREIDGEQAAMQIGQEQAELLLRRRPLRLLIRFGEAIEHRKDLRAALPEPPPPPILTPLVLEPDSDSPRGVAHAKLLNALSSSTHDAQALAEAIAEARSVGIKGEGMAAAEHALEALGGKGAVGPGERRRQAVRTFQTALASNNARELRSAVEELVEAGVEDPTVLRAAERAFDELDARRNHAVDMVVAALEEAVRSAERDPATGCPKERLMKLSRCIEEARICAGPQDEELLTLAGRLLEFESKRATALETLQDKIRERCVAMERIVSQATKRLPPPRSAAAGPPAPTGSAVAGKLLNAPGARGSSRLEAATASSSGQFVRKPSKSVQGSRPSSGAVTPRRSVTRPRAFGE